MGCSGNDKHTRQHRQFSDRLQLLLRPVCQVRKQADIGRQSWQVAEVHGMAVGRLCLQRPNCNLTRRTGLVVYDDRLVQRF